MMLNVDLVTGQLIHTGKDAGAIRLPNTPLPEQVTIKQLYFPLTLRQAQHLSHVQQHSLHTLTLFTYYNSCFAQ